MITVKLPYIILVASVPRSGGTWLFNAVRMILQEADRSCHCAWIDAYDSKAADPTHLIKAHKAEQVDFNPDLIFTSYRDIAERLSSLIRMGWLQDDRKSILKAAKYQTILHNYWHDRSGYEVDFENIIDQPAEVIKVLASYLGVQLNGSINKTIATGLMKLKTPRSGLYDPVTLLHPNHKADRQDARIRTELVRKVLESI